MKPFVIEERELDGAFCKIGFDDLEQPLLLYVADQDFEILVEMAGKEDVGWEKFRNELFTLVEHSGHTDQHELSEQTTNEIRDCLRELADDLE